MKNTVTALRPYAHGGIHPQPAYREEAKDGTNSMKIPDIVVYPDYTENSGTLVCKLGQGRQQIKDLWDKLPKMRDSAQCIPTLHAPNKKRLIRQAL